MKQSVKLRNFGKESQKKKNNQVKSGNDCPLFILKKILKKNGIVLGRYGL